MRNLRKLTAVVIAIALVLTSMTAAFAASAFEYEDEATVLQDLGILLGDDNGDLLLGEELTRAQGAILVLKTVLGKTDADMEAADTSVLSTFDDADKVPAWAEGWVALAVEEGVMKGGDNKLMAGDALVGNALASMFMNALGFADENEYATSVELLAAKSEGTTLSAIAEDIATGDLTRDLAAALVYDALTVTAKDADKNLIETYIAANPELADVAEEAGLIVVATELTVESVTSTNLREAFVKFSKEVDKTSAETEANYTSDAVVTDATLQSDKVTVKLTLTGAAQQKVLDLVIKNVKDASGTAITETKKSITLFDTTIPEALSYKFTGPQSLEVKFSEPINSTASSLNVLVDNGVYGASAAVKAGDEYTVQVSLGTVLPEGAHKLVVKGAKDFASYSALDKEFDITYTKDSSVSVVTLDSAAEKSVTIKFSKPVKFIFDGSTPAKSYFYQTYTTYQPAKVTTDGTTEITSGTYYDKVVLDFSNAPLPAGSTKVVVKAKVGSNAVADAYGIALPEDVVLTASITVDLTAPTVTKVEATAEDKVEITFSEDVEKAGAETKSNYTFKKADGTVVDAAKLSSVTYASKKATAQFTEKLAGGAYSVEIKNIKDNSVSANGMVSVPVTFTVTDKTAITAITEVLKTDDGKTLFVTFPENMATTGANSVLEKANYLYGASAATAQPLTNAAISVFGTPNKVKIVLASDFAANNLYVKSVADVAGNVMTAMYIEKVTTPDTAPAVTAIKTVATNKLEITVNKNLQSINAANILVDGQAVAYASYVNKDATAIITVILKDAYKLANGGALPATVGITADSTIKSITGKAMAAVADWTATVNPTDGVAPVVKEIRHVNATTIEVEFDEAIDTGSVAAVGKNGFAVVGGTLTSVSVAGSVITLTGSDFTENTDVTYTPGNIQDGAKNAVAAFAVTDTLK